MNDPANQGGGQGKPAPIPDAPSQSPQYSPENRAASLPSAAAQSTNNQNQPQSPLGGAPISPEGDHLTGGFAAFLDTPGLERLPIDHFLAHPVRWVLPPAPPDEPRSALERHARKCMVCHHPEREAIEEEYLNWHSPTKSASHHNVAPRTLYRHAEALGLTRRRRGNMRAVLDRLLDRAEEATVTGDSIIRALRAYTCLADDRHWVEPPARVIYSSEPNSPCPQSARESQRKSRARGKPRTAHRISPMSRSNRHSGD